MQIVTAALLYNDGKLYLLCQRPATDKLSLKWEFPGGKLEDGETPEQCLIREVREELCVDIAIVSHFHDTLYQYGTGKILLKFYLACITGALWNGMFIMMSGGWKLNGYWRMICYLPI